MIPYEELAAALARHKSGAAPESGSYAAAPAIDAAPAEPPPLEDATFNTPLETAEEEIGDEVLSEEEVT